MTTLSDLLRLQEEATAKDESWQADMVFCNAARNFDLKALATQYEAMRERLGAAEAVMLLDRAGKYGDAQVAYMDHCGKYLGEPSRG